MAISSVTFRFERNQCFADILQTEAEAKSIKIGNFTKRITEYSQSVNITPYLRAEFSYQPLLNGLLSNSPMAKIPFIVADGINYIATRPYFVGSIALPQNIASDLPYRVVANGQTDIISAGLKGGDEMRVGDEDVRATMRDDVGSIAVKVTTPTIDVDFLNKTAKVRYLLRPVGLNNKRLCWVNRYGVLEFWNFDHLREQSYTAATDKIYTAEGYKTISVEAEERVTVETKELPQDVMKALSYILISPAVWLVDDKGNGLTADNFTPIDILTEECRVYSDSELSTMQITYRQKQREIW